MKEKSTVFVAKKYEKLTIRDHFMFGKICSNPKNSQLILEALLNKDVNIMNDPEIEKTLAEYHNGKHVRLDLLDKDEDRTVYNAELQHKSNNKERQEELPRRGRYYRAILDKANFYDGMRYLDLPTVYVIFICTFDPFGENEAIYTFKTKCEEIPNLKYDDGSITLFFNATANLKNLPNKTRNMLEYIQNGTVNDAATKHLEAQVIAAREMEEWREEYMLTLVHDNDVYNDGYDSRQSEIDGLNAEIAAKDNMIVAKDNIIADKDAEIKRLKEQLEQAKRA